MMRGFFFLWSKTGHLHTFRFWSLLGQFHQDCWSSTELFSFFYVMQFSANVSNHKGGFERTPLIISVVIPSTEIWNNWYSAQVRAIALRYITLMISRHQPETKFRQTHTDRTFMNISLLNRLHLSLITSIMTLKLNCQPSLLFIVMI